ncbi:N-formylglutamate amidohydrolase [Novilysobacter avium]|uniref:N-formylglutamate amidohydrolase n=1 Tax=Novilysobacter avium TaxID=2781023 RepID=A0A7S6UMF0_9GAMM|nr:N-formylglutamate amidohydrolase [Lysobacter avium]QOW23007.1 N-formylglutamate amidohydrolase [Lysobacter avium]
MEIFDQPSPPWWIVQRGDDPIIATAIHDGHRLGAQAAAAMALDEAGRLREEDPHTGQAIVDIPTHVIAMRSRFEADLNRGLDQAVYLDPSQSWGLKVWQTPPEGELLRDLQEYHRGFYRMMGELLDSVVARHGRFVLLDVHSYNHRRDGADAPPTAQEDAPDVNIGTFSMPRDRWAFLLDPLMQSMGSFDFNQRRLDVRENIAFQGKGELTRFVHERYPETGCAIALEFKKFYMDEWTGRPYPDELAAMRAFINHTAAQARALLAGAA